MYAKMIASGSYLPEKIVTNQDLEQQLETSDEWIVSRTGIHQRHVAAEHETAVSMAVQASRRALEAANLQANALDMIIVATSTPDKVFPSTACLLQNELGAGAGIAFDVTAACSGFIYAFVTAVHYIQSGAASQVLVVGSELMTRLLNWQDRSTCILFGDGAGALILSASSEPGVHCTKLCADGAFGDFLFTNGPINYPDEPYLQMQGREVFKRAVVTLGGLVDEMLEAAKLPQSAIDWLIPHQANIRIIQAMAKKLQLSMSQVVTTVGQHANTSAASLPLALDFAIRQGMIQRGQRLLLEAFGGGFTWGAALVTY